VAAKMQLKKDCKSLGIFALSKINPVRREPGFWSYVRQLSVNERK
jgi:hypothetical protein